MRKTYRLRTQWKIALIIIGSLTFLNAMNTIKVTTEEYMKEYYESFKDINTTISGELVELEPITPEEVEPTPETEETIEPEPINMACSTGRAKTYMSYKAITNKTSKQYHYIKDHMKVDERGFLRDKDGNIGIALGSYFGEIGNKFQITLETGEILNVVKVEAKADEHTNNGCEQRWDKSVIEFVIDTTVARSHFGVSENGYILNGNYNNLFKGTITKINKVN